MLYHYAWLDEVILLEYIRETWKEIQSKEELLRKYLMENQWISKCWGKDKDFEIIIHSSFQWSLSLHLLNWVCENHFNFLVLGNVNKKLISTNNNFYDSQKSFV